ncbi:MAG TPA: FAD-binding oxidoreductase [Dactylosporangium sp.]|nr:FAD-binding oxidoreductase [Dactylosporangium sp.]
MSLRLVRPEDRRYPALRSTYTTAGAPAVIALPESAAEVAAAIAHGRERGLDIAVRSGGHGLAGTSTNRGGLVIDLSALHDVAVADPAARLVRVGAGARWADVAAALHPHGLAISSGDHGNVGVGGIATGGGVGWLARWYGLTIDHVRAAEVVLADGRIVRADAEHDPELLWAVRGAGAGVGIVTAFEIEAARVRDVGVAQLVVAADRDGAALRRWASAMREAPRELTSEVVMLHNGRSPVIRVTAVVAGGDPRRVREVVEPLRRIGTVLDHRVDRVPYPVLLPPSHKHPNVAQQPVTITNGLLPAMDGDAAEAVMALVRSGRTLVQLRSLGGAIHDVDPGATAYPHRHQHTLVLASMFPPDGRTELDAAWRVLAGRADGTYGNFESRRDRPAFARVYPGATGERVAAAWRRYDPGAVFRPYPI